MSHDASSNTSPQTLIDLMREQVEKVRNMLAAGTTTPMVLARLVSMAEGIAPAGSTSSILVLDEEGLLRNGASPNLPADYLNAIDRLKPDANLGTCAAAAATGEVVITPDFLSDDKWAELRHLPLALGYRGAWSIPIKATDGTVLGTFGTYFRECRSPTADERHAIAGLAAAAAFAISASRALPAL